MELRLTLILLLFVSSFPTFAQLSSLEEKKLKIKAINLIKSYELVCDNKDDDDREDFLLLFKNPETEILNDVIPANKTNSKISLNAYSDEIHKNFKVISNKTIFIESISIKTLDNDLFELEVLGEKYIAGNELKSDLIIEDTLEIKFILEFNKPMNQLKIKNIDLIENPKFYVFFEISTKGFFNNTPLINDSIFLENEKKITNDKGMVFQKIDLLDDQKTLTFKSLNEEIVQEKKITLQEIKTSIETKENGAFISIPFKVSIIDFYPSIGFVAGANSPIYFDDALNSNQSSTDFGFSLSLKLLEFKQAKLKIYTGTSWINWGFSSNLSSQNYQYESIDPDGASYLRKIALSNYQANSRINAIQVPLGIEITYPITSKIELIGRSGIILHKTIKASYSASAEIQYSGYYEELFQITMNENGVYDFGRFEISKKSEIDLNQKLFLLSNGIGVIKKLNRKIGLFAMANHQVNLNNVFTSIDNRISSNNSELNYLNVQEKSGHINLININLGIKLKL
jgi:hypothetical protein